MSVRRGVAAAVAVAVTLVAGCWRAPPPPPDRPADFEWTAPLDLAGRESRFFRFDIPDSAPGFARRKNEPYYFGAFSHLAVFDANGHAMTCGGFDRQEYVDGYPGGAGVGMIVRSVTQDTVPVRLAPETARAALCTNDAGEISVFCKIAPDDASLVYRADFDAAGDVIRSSIQVKWSATPAGGTVERVRFLGEGFAGQIIRDDVNARGIQLQTIGGGSGRLESPIYFRTRGTPPGFTPQRVIVQASLRRADRFAHWFQASGSPPYRLQIDEHNGRCAAHDLFGDALPREAADAGWPPVATVGVVSKNDRGVLDTLRAGIPVKWRRWADWFVIVYGAGLIMAVAFRWLRRRKT